MDGTCLLSTNRLQPAIKASQGRAGFLNGIESIFDSSSGIIIAFKTRTYITSYLALNLLQR